MQQYISFKFIYLFSKSLEWGQRKVEPSSTGSFSQQLQQLIMGQNKGGSQELHIVFPPGQKGPKCLCPLLLFTPGHKQGVALEGKQLGHKLEHKLFFANSSNHNRLLAKSCYKQCVFLPMASIATIYGLIHRVTLRHFVFSISACC